jgi:hypothetical protein
MDFIRKQVILGVFRVEDSEVIQHVIHNLKSGFDKVKCGKGELSETSPEAFCWSES